MNRAGRLLAALAAAGVLAGCAAAVEGEGARVIKSPPVAWLEWDPETGIETRNVGGFLLHKSRDPAQGRSRTHFFWPLGLHSVEESASGERRRLFRALPFVWLRHTSEPSGSGERYYQIRVNVLGPVFGLDSDNYGEGHTDAHFLWPFGYYFRGERRIGGELRNVRSFRLLPIVQHDRSWRPRESSDVRAEETLVFRLLHFAFSYERDDRESKRRYYVLGAAPTDHTTGRKDTFGAWAYDRGPSTDREHQLLWRLFLLKRWDAPDIDLQTPAARPSDRWRMLQWTFRGSRRTLARAGLVATWETNWEDDYRRFSFLAGLVGYERTGRAKSGRVLWFIPWRAGEHEPEVPPELAERW